MKKKGEIPLLDERPLVTVVTATYKRFDTLFDSIDSVFKQDYPNIEYVITDDGSENFPYEKIKQYIDSLDNKNVKNVMILTAEKNRGTVKNLNNAYQRSNGKYIINLSCGDVFFSEDVISKIKKRFIKKKANVVVTSRVLYKEKNHPIAFLPHYNERKIITSKYKSSIDQYKGFVLGLSYDMASGSAMSYSRAIIEKYGYFDERYCLFEDGPFLEKYLYNSKLCFAYDIISIWYEAAGVSSSGGARNPIYQKDLDRFNQHDRKKHLDILTYSEKKKIDFCFAFLKTGRSKAKKLMALMRYFPYSLCYVHYNWSRKRNAKNDLKYIETIKK